jgi:multidrug efflux pump subunit AcrA (membrane-fusion protein)
MKAPTQMPFQMRGRWLNLVLGIVLVGAIATAYFMVGSSEPTAAVSTRTATVTQGSLTATVTGSGNLASSRTSSLAFGASGKVTAVNVKVGDKVKKGQTLARIDTASAQRTLTAARASLESAQASYDELTTGQTALEKQSAALQVESAQQSVTSAKKSLTKAKAQLATDTKAKAPSATLSKDEDAVDQARSQVTSAQVKLAQQKATNAKDAEGATAAQIAQAEVSIQNAQVTVDDAEDALDATKLKAPFAGTILTVTGEEGDAVSSGSSSSTSSSSGSSSSGSSSSSSGGSSSGAGTSTGTTTSSSSSSSAFITMASLSSLDVTATIAEADIGSLKVGQAAEVTLSADDQVMTGTVSAVSPSGTTSSNVVQYPVTVSVDDPVASARLGASVSVTITTGSAENALILPTSAITTSGSRHTVARLKNGVTTTTVIETGLEGSSTTEITSGLSAGDVVQIPTTTTTTTSGVPGFGGGGAARGIGGGGGR